jgi:putative tributyrin esterase
MPQSVETVGVPSVALGGEQPVAILPPDVLTRDGRCFTLLLLHGMGGDEGSWPRNCDLAALFARLPILVAMPSARDSFYLDSPVAAMETYIYRELLPYLDANFPTIPSAAGRGLTGLSMGGYGALLLALRNPNLFGSAASHSGAVLTSRATTEVGVRWELADKLYGVGPEGETKRRDHDLLVLAQRLRREDEDTGRMAYDGPVLYLDCGTEDFLFYASREFTQALRMARVPYEFHEYPGDHDWSYWGAHLRDSLRFHCRRWGIDNPDRPPSTASGGA